MGHLIVTGGSRGIGAALCRLAAPEGWDVTLSFRSDADAAARVAAEAEAAGRRALAVRGDVADEAHIRALFDRAEAAHGPVTGVCVNAGITAPAMPLAEMETARIERVLRTNLLGAILTAREAARRMPLSRGGRGGAIVIVSSTAARLGAAFDYVDYAATKGAMDSLTIGLSKELAADGVRVNAVRPGIIETEIHSHSGIPGRAAKVGATSPMGRPGTAAETAEAILWLLSGKASYVTGAFIDVGGGR